jgi:hypothetical protein
MTTGRYHSNRRAYVIIFLLQIYCCVRAIPILYWGGHNYCNTSVLYWSGLWLRLVSGDRRSLNPSAKTDSPGFRLLIAPFYGYPSKKTVMSIDFGS